jgi:hypothetical protein
VPTDLDISREWLDVLWALFGENRVMFVSE